MTPNDGDDTDDAEKNNKRSINQEQNAAIAID